MIFDSKRLDINERSETDKEGVSVPKLKVYMLDYEREADLGLEKIDCAYTVR